MTERTQLYRNLSNSSIGGVCSGLGDYLNADPVIFRILFIIAFFIGGSGLIIYIALWIVIPEQPIQKVNTDNLNNSTMDEKNQNTESGFQKPEQPEKPQKSDGNLWGGLILIALGGIFLIIRFVPRIDFGDLWPVLLIVIGIVLIAKSYQTKN